MNPLDQARDKVLRENTAQTVFKYLDAIENSRAKYASRWIWELVQNARDAAATGTPATLEVVLLPNKLLFRHDGAPFREEEIAHLIYYGSSKRAGESSDPIGHFGSGFLTTHVLAKRIAVTGRMHDGAHFHFVLNREGNSPEELSDAMDASWEDFKKSLSDAADFSAFTTEYCYPLLADTWPIAQSGLSALARLAPYTLCFNSKLREIRIEADGKPHQILVPNDVDGEQVSENVSLVPVRMHDQHGLRDRSVAIATSDGVSVAVITEKVGENRTIILDPSSPRLFVAFPLLGTERFCFPAVVNCEQFRVREDRDGIWLGTDDTEAIRTNKSLVLTACSAYLNLLRAAGTKEWWHLQGIALLPEFETYPWLDDEWYRRLLAKLVISPAREIAIARTRSGRLACPKAVCMPVPDSDVSVDDIWNLSSGIRELGELLPPKSDAQEWYEVLARWASVLSTDIDDFEEAWTLKKLSLKVAGLGSIGQLKAALTTNISEFAWLNDFYACLHRAKRLDLFESVALLPDQTGVLRSRSALQIDEGIDEALKDIATKLDLSAREELVDTRVDLARIPDLKKKSQDELLGQVLQRIGANPVVECSSQSYRQANVSLFEWLLRQKRIDKFRGFPCLSEHAEADRPHVISLVREVEEPEQIPLAPCDVWPAGARTFEDLFPPRFILSREYAASCSDSPEWHTLAERGFIRLDPVFDSRSRHGDLLPSEPLTDVDSGKEHDIVDELTFSSIAFFSTTKVGVIDRVRGSQIRARQLLHFVAEYVLSRDPTAFDVVQSSCACGDVHAYYRGEWLRPLRERIWVPIGEKQNAPPTADSLAKLLSDEPAFLRQIAEGEAAHLLDALGIGRSELLLRASTADEDKRIQLVTSALDMNEAVGGDTARLKEITTLIRNDPGVLTDIANASATRATVRRNQDIGSTVERYLKQLLEAPETGIKVTRRHIGHDFEVENDLVDETTEGKIEIGFEVASSVSSYLIEVKASAYSQFRITPKQAETSVQHGDRFIVCMVDIPIGRPIALDDVRNGARFLPGIGKDLKELWDNFLALEAAREHAPKRAGDIELEIEDAKVRFRLGRAMWEKGLIFEDAIDLFRRTLHSR